MKAILIVPLIIGFIAMAILFSALGVGAFSAGFLFGVVQWSVKKLYNAALELEP